ncbi:MAG: hypothetical protein ACHRXM_34520 [Isosphaerales bacterium]
MTLREENSPRTNKSIPNDSVGQHLKLMMVTVYNADRPRNDSSSEAALRELRTVDGGMGWIVPESNPDSVEVTIFGAGLPEFLVLDTLDGSGDNPKACDADRRNFKGTRKRRFPNGGQAVV